MPLFGPPDIGKLKSNRNVRGLINALDRKYPNEIRAEAARALGEIGDKRAAIELNVIIRVAQKSHENEDVLRNAAFALGEIGEGKAVIPLTKYLDDKDPEIRMKAAELLGKLGNSQPVASLIKLLGDSHGDVVASAKMALNRMGGVTTIDALEAALTDENPKVRRHATDVLGAFTDERLAVFPLFKALEDDDVIVKKTAIIHLGKTGDLLAVNRLVILLGDENKDVVESAKIALVKLTENRKPGPYLAQPIDVISKLEETLLTKGPGIRKHAVDVLGVYGAINNKEIRETVLNSLITSLKDEDKYVRAAAALHLGNIGDKRATEPLHTLEGDKSELVRDAAVAAYMKILQSGFIDLMNFGR